MPIFRWPGLKITCVFLIVSGVTSCQSEPSVVVADVVDAAPIPQLETTHIASVNGTYVYKDDISRYAARIGHTDMSDLQPGNPEYSKILDELIDRRLLSLDATRRALDDEPETRQNLAIARDRILSAIRAEKHLAETVTEEALRAEYEKQKALGRTQSFEDSRDEIENLLRVEALDSLLRSLRGEAEVKLTRAEPQRNEPEKTED